MPSALRQLFAIILAFCNPSNPYLLWETHRNVLSEDFLHAARNELNNPNLEPSDAIYNQTLLAIENIMVELSSSLAQFDGFVLPQDPQTNAAQPEPRVFQLHRQIARQLELTPVTPRLHFIDGSGGTGKTYIFNAILEHVRRQGNIALAVATSRTAALLLDGRCTAHSTFAIPLNASMVSKDTIHAVDRTLRNLMRHRDNALEHVPFGGKIVVFGGDFRQVLPVIRNGTRAQIVNQSLNRANFWNQVTIHHLRTNMRVQQARNVNDANTLREFSEYLLRIGDGTEDRVHVQDSMILPGFNLYTLINTVYRDMLSTPPTNDHLTSRAILTPKNKYVTDINNLIIEQLFPGGNIEEFLSADSMANPEDQLSYPAELLNELNPSSLPPHRLKLKPGCPVMLLRNLNPSKGLCNGIRLICRSFRRYVIEAEIVTGSHAGDIVLIPRITLTPTNSDSPIQFSRTQFPIRLAFAMTINKAQGQTMDQVGLYLPEHPFAHGLLYVAMSRVRTPTSIHITLDRDNSSINGLPGFYTRNVVYREVLL
ncbi:hypothetical protein INT45_011842 [Circinella minor]|uniref:ATP-dependent DNA helicase n=1 Tax=Circinella minor TaxID=1195481 RepID=A0A8H7VDT8_9FUNG|nr:hypothetical protein INT45_011842 [Circinella minor]